LSIENQITNIQLAQYDFILDDKPLIEKELVGSKIISEKKHSSINTIELNLENGVKIYLKPTKNEINSFEFVAQSLGGYSHASLEDYHSAKSAEDLINAWIGFGSFSRSKIKNKIDEQTNLKIWIGRFYEGLEGSAKTDKAEELFKLIYLRFAPLKIDEVVFQNFISFLEERKRNEDLNYKRKFNRKVIEELCKNLPRCKTIEFKDISKIKIKKIEDFYDNRFADSSDFVFTFAGDFKIEDMKPYIQKYLGSLPNINRKESYIDNNIIFNGRSTFEVKKNTENSASISYVFSSKYTNLAKNRATIYLANNILNRLLNEEIREKQKLVYSIGSFESLYPLPKPNHLMFIYFNCNPKNVKLIFSKIDEILLKIKKGDFDDKYLADAKEKKINDLKESKQSNSFWVGSINRYNFNKENFKKMKNFHQILSLINKKDIVNYFNKTFKENFVKGSFLPK